MQSMIVIRRSVFIVAILFCYSYSFAINLIDTLPPHIYIVNICGDYTVSVTETRVGAIIDNTQQKDVGVKNPPQLVTNNNRTYNFSSIELNENFVPETNNKEFTFSLNVIDKYKEAVDVFFVYDNSEKQNIRYDSIRYKPKLLELSGMRIDYGSVRVGDSISRNSVVINPSSSNILIKSVSLKLGKYFNLKHNYKIPILMTDTSKFQFNIAYSPENEISDNNKKDIDSLIIETDCLRFAFSIEGYGVIPRIVVEDYDFGMIETNSTKCYGDLNEPESIVGLRIYNPGTGVLVLNGVYPLDTEAHFELSNPLIPFLQNYQVYPGGEVYIKSICFKPNEAGEFIDDLIFKNNAKGPDSIARLRGLAYDKGPYLSSFNFGDTRLKSKKSVFISLKNSGTQPVELTNLKLKHLTSDFKILFDKMLQVPSDANPIIIYPQDWDKNEYPMQELLIPVEFSPQVEYVKSAIIEASFANKNEIPDGKIFNYLYGYGVKSGIKATGFEFNPRVLVNYEHPDIGIVEIFSTGITAHLFIKNIILEPVQPLSQNDFKFLSPIPENYSIPKGTSLKIPVKFRPIETGERKLLLKIVTDAFEGDISDGGLDTTIVSVAGNSYLNVLYAKNFDYGLNYQCSERSEFVVFNNTSATDTAKIFKIELVSGDIDAFKIEDNSYVSGFETIKPGSKINIPVIFKPKNFEQTHFEAIIKMTADIDTCLSIVRGDSYQIPLTIRMDTLNDMVPGILTRNKLPNYPYKDFPVRIESKNIASIMINEFTVELIYNRMDLLFAGIIDEGDVTKDWHFYDYNETYFNTEYKILTVKAKGMTRILENGILFKPVFKLLLGDTTFLDVKFGNISLFEENNCAHISALSGRINYSGCGIELRNILISHNDYSFGISQNNSNSESITFEYGIGLDAYTNISVYNSIGELIKVIYDGSLNSGIYQQTLPFFNIGTGIYFAKFSSGPFSKTLKFSISK